MLQLNTYETLVAASLVLLAGRKLIAVTPFLKTYSIPEPVVGGLVVAFGLFAARAFAGGRWGSISPCRRP